MPRRRPQPPPAGRLAAILGLPSAATALATAEKPLAGWVPQRASVARPAPLVTQARLAVPPEVAPPLVLPAVVLPRVTLPGMVLPRVVSPSAVQPAVVRPVVVPPARAAPGLPDGGRHRRPGPPKPAILTVPMALRGARARPRRLAVLGALVLLVAVAAIVGIRVAWAQSAARPASIGAAAPGPPGGLVTRTVPAAFASTGSTGLPTVAAVLVVDVVGQVRRSGVVRLPPGSRVLDAVNAAGGAKPSADLNLINLARVLADGEQIVVPKPGEAVPGASGSQGAGSPAGSSGQGSAGSGSAGGLVDLNTADASALDSLPGVGPVLSQRILDWRTAHGRFSSVDELGEVSGIGDKLLAQIGPKVKV